MTANEWRNVAAWWRQREAVHHANCNTEYEKHAAWRASMCEKNAVVIPQVQDNSTRGE